MEVIEAYLVTYPQIGICPWRNKIITKYFLTKDKAHEYLGSVGLDNDAIVPVTLLKANGKYYPLNSAVPQEDVNF